MSKQIPMHNEVDSGMRLFFQQKLRLIINILKFIWLGTWLILATLLVFPPIMISTLFSATGNIPFHLSKVWAWIILTVAGVKLSIKGQEKIQKGQTYIIISNHQSHLDGPAIALTLGIQFRWVAKKELLKIPIFGHCLYACGNIFIDRSDRERALQGIQDGIDRLPLGVGVMFFAEGTRSATGRLNQFKKGGFSAALKTGLPILPLTINNSSQVLPKNGLVYKPGPIEVVVGEPIDVSLYSTEQIDELLNDTKEIIKSNLQFD